MLLFNREMIPFDPVKNSRPQLSRSYSLDTKQELDDIDGLQFPEHPPRNMKQSQQLSAGE